MSYYRRGIFSKLNHSADSKQAKDNNNDINTFGGNDTIVGVPAKKIQIQSCVPKSARVAEQCK